MELSYPQHIKWLEEGVLEGLWEGRLELLRQGVEVLDLSMINPDLAPPRFLIDKLTEATLRVANHRYSVSRGIRKLRSAFTDKYLDTFGIRLNPDSQVCVTMGTKDALVNALNCLKGPNAQVLVGSPVYPAYSAAIKYSEMPFGCFQVTADQDQMLGEIKTKLQPDKFNILLLNFPNNPTGVTVDEGFYRGLAKLGQRLDVFVLNDFVYGEMAFNQKPAVSLFQENFFQTNGAEIYSLSKAYSIPGWRVGALTGSSNLIDRVAKLKSRLDYGVFLPFQIAAAAALVEKTDLCSDLRASYQDRCEELAKGLARLGCEVATPAAGCSVWARLESECDALDFCLRFLNSEKILLLPGAYFGPEYGSYVRFAAVVPVEKIQVVLERLKAFKELRG